MGVTAPDRGSAANGETSVLVVVALGVVAMYLIAAVEISSLLMRRLPRRVWHGIHLGSYVLFWVATFHLISAGSDADHALSRVVTAAVIAAVVFLTLVRALGGKGRGADARARPRPTAATPG